MVHRPLLLVWTRYWPTFTLKADRQIRKPPKRSLKDWKPKRTISLRRSLLEESMYISCRRNTKSTLRVEPTTKDNKTPHGVTARLHVQKKTGPGFCGKHLPRHHHVRLPCRNFSIWVLTDYPLNSLPITFRRPCTANKTHPV
jgi:hypothetical protein